MISFKQFTEAWLDASTGSKAQRKHWNTSPNEAKINASRTVQIGETHDHTIHKIDKGVDDPEEGTNNVVYYARKKGSQRIDATINGTEKGHAVHIDSMATHPDGEMKMHHLIHHIVTNHGKSVGSSHYSPGGKKVMDRVGEMDGVDITHWKDHKKVHPADPYADDKDTPEHEKTYVVAQPRIHHTFRAVDFHKDKLNEDGNPEYDKFHEKELSNGYHAAVIKKYTKGSRSLNNYLHARHDGAYMSEYTGKPAKMDHFMEKRIRDMDGVFADKKNHVGHEIHVHTGLPESPEHVIKKETKRQGQKPRHVHLHMVAYTSATDDENVAKDFSEQDHNLNKHVLHLHVPKDHPIISAVKHSALPKEREFILHRGSHIKLNTEPVVDEDGTHHWFGKVTGRHGQ